MVNFQSVKTFMSRGNRFYVVHNDKERSSLSGLIGSEVLIDGEVKRVKAVEFKAHTAPWKKGEFISLGVEG